MVDVAWTLANPGVSSAIIGVRTLAHLDDVNRAAELKLDHEIIRRLNDTFNINMGRPLMHTEAPEAYSW